MPPPSSPVPRLSSAPSDVLTVQTIASRSPLRHHRTSNQDDRKGGRLVRFAGDDSLIGQFLDVTITGCTTWSLVGEVK